MFFIDAISAVIIVVLSLLLFGYLVHQKLNINWGKLPNSVLVTTVTMMNSSRVMVI